MTGFESFSNIEVYVIKRALIESCANIFMNATKYGKNEFKALHSESELKVSQELLNRAIEEDGKRLYGNEHTVQSQFADGHKHPYD